MFYTLKAAQRPRILHNRWPVSKDKTCIFCLDPSLFHLLVVMILRKRGTKIPGKRSYQEGGCGKRPYYCTHLFGTLSLTLNISTVSKPNCIDENWCGAADTSTNTLGFEHQHPHLMSCPVHPHSPLLPLRMFSHQWAQSVAGKTPLETNYLRHGYLTSPA